MIKSTDRAYLAGLFDGEGCVYVSPRGYVRPSICQQDPYVLRWIQSLLGYGQVRQRGIGNKTGRPYHVWTCSRHDEIRDFLKLVYPFSMVKKGEIRVAYRIVGLWRTADVTRSRRELAAEFRNEFRSHRKR